jgi:hypothetical protein
MKSMAYLLPKFDRQTFPLFIVAQIAGDLCATFLFR